MKSGVGIILSAIGLFVAQCASAQGTLYVSNLEQTPVGSAPIGNDAWIAQTFGTGTNSGGYVLNSVQLLMGVASGSPSAFTIAIYSDAGNGVPGTSLGSLSGIDPSAGGLFNYTGSDIVLSPAALYSVVVSGVTPVAQGAFSWSACDSFGIATIGPGDPWTIRDYYYSSANGLNWTFHPRQNVFQFGINATEVPEPSSWALLLLGGSALALYHRGKTRPTTKALLAAATSNQKS